MNSCTIGSIILAIFIVGSILFFCSCLWTRSAWHNRMSFPDGYRARAFMSLFIFVVVAMAIIMLLNKKMDMEPCEGKTQTTINQKAGSV